MARVKRGMVSRRRHNKLLAATKGQRATRHNLIRRAHEAFLHSGAYAYAHRRERRGDMRRMWILRINAAARANGDPLAKTEGLSQPRVEAGHVVCEAGSGAYDFRCALAK